MCAAFCVVCLPLGTHGAQREGERENIDRSLKLFDVLVSILRCCCFTFSHSLSLPLCACVLCLCCLLVQSGCWQKVTALYLSSLTLPPSLEAPICLTLVCPRCCCCLSALYILRQRWSARVRLVRLHLHAYANLYSLYLYMCCGNHQHHKVPVEKFQVFKQLARRGPHHYRS